jgi:glycosyltransferase involved in cell wall biosynthesis
VNVAFVNYHDFTSNSAVHICNLANELTAAGTNCAVLVPDDPGSIAMLPEHRFQALDFRDARTKGIDFPDGRPPSLVHAWTPREVVREVTEELNARYHCPYLVHLEDNEDVITADSLGSSVAQLRAASPRELSGSFPPTLSHPRRMRRFLAGAAGVTVIMDRLLEFRPSGIPAEVVWPGYEQDLFTGEPGEPELRRQLGITSAESVIVYAGNAHASNAAEMRSLYLAVAAVNRTGRRLRLVRLGRDFVDFLGAELKPVESHVVHVPLQPRSEVPRYMRLADVLVQPGRVDDFNEYRFPSKLPEFFATGRPVVLPAANLGRFLEDGVDCILLRRGDALEIAAVLERLLDDDESRARLGSAARSFAERTFSWNASAEKLSRLYERVLAPAASPSRHQACFAANAAAVGKAASVPPQLGYATVRDYCDSAERLPGLASLSGDLKDVQRPWALKSIRALLPPGARLLEIGAGEPVVAGLLADAGYDVTVIDPYDGRDRGPVDVRALRAAYPRVRIEEGLFPRDVHRDPGAFDCVYSISVLEHMTAAALDEVCAGIASLTRDGGYTIHAVDHVLQGVGAEEHLARLRRVVVGLGLTTGELDELLSGLSDDPDTYFLSAESHNRWRGGTTYDEFPMRRCVSIQFCLPVSNGD